MDHIVARPFASAGRAKGCESIALGKVPTHPCVCPPLIAHLPQGADSVLAFRECVPGMLPRLRILPPVPAFLFWCT